ncbi:MAG: CpaF family protein [Firmicutes bacterium]|nr:CpaF family protein [Bacillota bacterium]
MPDVENLREEITTSVQAELGTAWQVSDRMVLERIDEKILEAQRRENLSLEEMEKLRADIFHAIRQFDVLQDLLDDPQITEIMINGPDRIFVERRGRIQQTDFQFTSREKLENIIQQMVSQANRTVNEAHPIADTRLPDGSRVSIVQSPAALNGPILTIRRFPKSHLTMEDLVRLGSLSREAADFVMALARARYNIFISGGTGSGKTTFLNALSDAIPGDERIITIEDNAELQISHLPNLVRLEARDRNLEGATPIPIRELIRAALRMRPDRIIVGEVRGEEALDMLQAMNTGHDGSLSTGHANSARDMMARIETMIQFGNLSLSPEAVRSQIASAIDIVVHLSRLRDRTRRVVEIAETCGVRDGQVSLHTLYAFREEGEEDGIIQGSWEKTGILQKTQKLAAAGIPEAKSPSPP